MAGADEGRANIGFIGAIVAVATIGGLMFGYDRATRGCELEDMVG